MKKFLKYFGLTLLALIVFSIAVPKDDAPIVDIQPESETLSDSETDTLLSEATNLCERLVVNAAISAGARASLMTLEMGNAERVNRDNIFVPFSLQIENVGFIEPMSGSCEFHEASTGELLIADLNLTLEEIIFE